MKDLLSELKNSTVSDPQLEMLIVKLHGQLKISKGKKVYGYLQPNVKKTVDQIVATLAKNPVLKKMYEEWCSLEQQKYETYTSNLQKFPPLEENKVFKPIKNAVIRAVLEMEFSAEMLAKYGEEKVEPTKQSNVVLSLLLSFGRLISDDYNRSLQGQKLRTEYKLKAAIRRKKQALGLKESPLENQQFKE